MAAKGGKNTKGKDNVKHARGVGVKKRKHGNNHHKMKGTAADADRERDRDAGDWKWANAAAEDVDEDDIQILGSDDEGEIQLLGSDGEDENVDDVDTSYEDKMYHHLLQNDSKETPVRPAKTALQSL